MQFDKIRQIFSLKNVPLLKLSGIYLMIEFSGVYPMSCSRLGIFAPTLLRLLHANNRSLKCLILVLYGFVDYFVGHVE